MMCELVRSNDLVLLQIWGQQETREAEQNHSMEKNQYSAKDKKYEGQGHPSMLDGRLCQNRPV